MKILEVLGQLAETHSQDLKRYQPVQTVKQFKKIIFDELDLNKERSNLNRFIENFAGDDTVNFPKPFDKFSGKNILTIEYMDGDTLQEVIGSDISQVAKSKLARKGANILLDMVFRDNFYHADPQPGNFFIQENGLVAVIDCGMVGRIEEENFRLSSKRLLII